MTIVQKEQHLIRKQFFLSKIYKPWPLTYYGAPGEVQSSTWEYIESTTRICEVIIKASPG